MKAGQNAQPLRRLGVGRGAHHRSAQGTGVRVPSAPPTTMPPSTTTSACTSEGRCHDGDADLQRLQDAPRERLLPSGRHEERASASTAARSRWSRPPRTWTGVLGDAGCRGRGRGRPAFVPSPAPITTTCSEASAASAAAAACILGEGPRTGRGSRAGRCSRSAERDRGGGRRCLWGGEADGRRRR